MVADFSSNSLDYWLQASFLCSIMSKLFLFSASNCSILTSLSATLAFKSVVLASLVESTRFVNSLFSFLRVLLSFNNCLSCWEDSSTDYTDRSFCLRALSNSFYRSSISSLMALLMSFFLDSNSSYFLSLSALSFLISFSRSDTLLFSKATSSLNFFSAPDLELA